MKIKKAKPNKKLLFGFLRLKLKLNKEQVAFPLSKHFLKRYRKLNKEAYELTKIKNE